MPQFAVILPAAGKSSRFRDKEKKPFTSLDGRAVQSIRLFESICRKPILLLRRPIIDFFEQSLWIC